MSTPCAENSSSIWTCGFTGANGYVSQAVWYPGTGKKTYTVPAGFINYLNLSGVETSISAGASVTLGQEPILLQNQTTAVVGPNFSVAIPTPFPEVNAGSTGTSGSISITSQYGFTGTVSLSCVTTYGSGSCSVTPPTVSTYPATVSLVINGTSFTAGSYQISVQGKSGSITQTLNVPFTVGDFTLSGPATLVSAGTATANLTLTSLDSYSGQINTTCDASMLAGATCTLSPANPIPVASGATVPVTATITPPTSAASGTYNIVVSAADASGNPNHSLTIALTVNTTFTLGAVTPATQAINPGQSAAYNFSVQPVGGSFPGAVTLSCSGAPAMSTCSFNPSSVTPGSTAAPVVMTIATTASSASVRPRRTLFYALWLALPGFVLLSSATRRRRVFLSVSLLALCLLVLSLASCGGGGGGTSPSTGGGGGGGGTTQQGTQPGTYTITVTGTSGTVTSQAQTVTLTVN
jgi:hypothetical protein